MAPGSYRFRSPIVRDHRDVPAGTRRRVSIDLVRRLRFRTLDAGVYVGLVSVAPFVGRFNQASPRTASRKVHFIR